MGLGAAGEGLRCWWGELSVGGRMLAAARTRVNLVFGNVGKCLLDGACDFPTTQTLTIAHGPP